ncbi:MAG: deoxyuridine 5'-triphosphate nucleotidohydrolase [Clostridia bacterium]|nr:deoxyuridine 5'-triphosphate nucleotidohydrolase [Clostridia bacterium]
MQKIAQFMKVSQERFAADWEFDAPNPYEELKLPRRGTAGSAGYDFYSPLDFTLAPGEFIKIPTGIRARIDEGWVLTLYPRSGQGFKYRLQLYNSVGVIDSDYFGAENEGHIQIKIVNANEEGKTLSIRRGEAFAQGVFLPYGVTVDDDAAELRTGGFGSTDRK